MRRVFADANFWCARVSSNDQWHEKALEAERSLGGAQVVTTDEVLIEFLAGISGTQILRKTAAQMVRRILDNPNVAVLAQTRSAFLEGLDLFESRPDKSYSLTDCISMQAMRREGLTEILTHDHHFVQEGFTILMK
jgi:predicted nucleic acid-binding protein